jgi:Fe-S cluster biosynthesis and repair protein YggX
MSDQVRKEFEEWAEKRGYTLKMIAQQDGLGTEIYANGQTRSAWQGWQASRQALVVELSKLPEASYSTAGTCYMSDVESALDKAGVSYK